MAFLAAHASNGGALCKEKSSSDSESAEVMRVSPMPSLPSAISERLVEGCEPDIAALLSPTVVEWTSRIVSLLATLEAAPHVRAGAHITSLPLEELVFWQRRASRLKPYQDWASSGEPRREAKVARWLLPGLSRPFAYSSQHILV